MNIFHLTGPALTGGSDEGYFANYNDIVSSIHISYGNCKDVRVETTPRATGGPEITVTGTTAGGESFKEVFHVRRVDVWDRPTHL